mmetsp:Transcript_155315/g.289745  ORF Transcript_155315/g.289745 Transcript_155315/m.289745 type:complete len:630 (-) Transcript_155315:78-1967(-)
MAREHVVNVWRDDSGLLGFTVTESPLAILKVTDRNLCNSLLFEGDQIRAINGVHVKSLADLEERVRSLNQFDMTVVSLWPIQELDTFLYPVKVCFGLKSTPDMGFAVDRNLVVTRVWNQKSLSPTLLRGDRIASVQGKLILTKAEFNEAIQGLNAFEIMVLTGSVAVQCPGVVNTTVRTVISPIQVVEQGIRVLARMPIRAVSAVSNSWKTACPLAQICATVTKVSYYDPAQRPRKLFFKNATLELDISFNDDDYVVYACHVFSDGRKGVQRTTQLVLLGYRGTNDAADVVADAGIVLGLNDLFTLRNGQHALSPLRRVLQRYQISSVEEEGDGPVLVTTGHSLGGARAMLAASHPQMREYFTCVHVFNPGCGLYDQNDAQRPGLLWTLLDTVLRLTTMGRGLGHSVRRLTGLFADVDSFFGDLHFRINVHHTFGDVISACQTASTLVRVFTYAPRYPRPHSMRNFRDQRKKAGPDQFEQLVCVKATAHEHDEGGAWRSGREADKAWDGNPETFYDAAQANGGYTSADLGAACSLALIAYRTRCHHQDRMCGGKFEGRKDLESSWELLHTITETPARHPAFNYSEVINDEPFRYIRYIGPDGGHCNIGDIKVFVEVKHSLDLCKIEDLG